MQQRSSRSARTRPSPLHRSIQAAFALGSLVLCVLGATVGACSGEGEQCVGGVVINGVCEGKCEPIKCLEGNTCVGNRCVLVCDSHADCYPGTQDCASVDANGNPIVEDGTGTPVSICASNDKDVGFGQVCPFGNECGRFGMCPDGKECSLIECGRQPTDPDFCVNGTCSNNGAPCAMSNCAPSECSVTFTCLTTGEGDADAYCTRSGCTTDDECPGGYECGITRLPNELCGEDKGNNNFCGTTNEACINASDLAGQGLLEGSLCILQHTCIKREQCASCGSDLDCSIVEGQRCIDIGGEQRCARTCNVDNDCDPDYRCDGGACKPRFGMCRGTGGFCEPCQDDTDCCPEGSTECGSLGCAELSGGQRACFDFTFGAQCPSGTDAECPTSPGGKHGECLDEGEGIVSGDELYRRCYFPYNATDNKFGCW